MATGTSGAGAQPAVGGLATGALTGLLLHHGIIKKQM